MCVYDGIHLKYTENSLHQNECTIATQRVSCTSSIRYNLWWWCERFPTDLEAPLDVTEVLGHHRESASLGVVGWSHDPLQCVWEGRGTGLGMVWKAIELFQIPYYYNVLRASNICELCEG